MNIYKDWKALRRHPVLRHELKMQHIPREALDFPLFRRTLIIVILTIHAALGFLEFGFIFEGWLNTPQPSPAPTNWIILPLLVLVVHIGISILVDIVAIVRTVYWWQMTQRQEQLDILRTTLPDDRDLLNIFTALNVMRSWRAMQFDVALRAIIMVIAFAAAYFSAMEAIASGQDWGRFGLFASVAVCAAVGGLTYARNPARRLRATALFSTWSAMRMKESIVAILLAVAGCLALRLVIAAVFTVVIYQSLVMMSTLNMRSLFDPANAGMLTSYYVWFIGLTLVFWLGSRYFYAALNAFFENRTLAALRSGS